MLLHALGDAPVLPHRRDVVFTFSQLSWHAARARGMYFPEDRLADALLRDADLTRVIVANQLRSGPVVRARRLLRREDEGFPTLEGRRLVQPVRLARGEPVRLRAARRAYASYDAQLRRAAQRLGMQRPAVITANPLAAAFCPLEWASAVTYYAVDDWLAHPAYARLRTVHAAAYAELRARRRRVCAVSATLLDVLDPTGRAAVVPNGVEPAEWLADVPVAPRPDGPRLLYVGTLDDRLDVGALLRLARRLPEAEIVLAGPLADPAHLRPLREAGAVRILPPLDRRRVTALLRGADVCLLPHRSTPLTRAMSPLKVYEYLAAGRPVVATDLPPVRGIDERVLLVPPGGGLTDAVHAALALGPAAEEDRRAFVAANAWGRRHERILELALC